MCDEKVLVFDYKDIDSLFKFADQNKQFISYKDLSITYLFSEDEYKKINFIERDEAEQAVNKFVQPIPYTIVFDFDNRKFLIKKRINEREKRLNNLCGFIGGHVNECDICEGENAFDALKNCCIRELLEEIGDVIDDTKDIIGLKNIGLIWIRNSDNDVDRVHLGVVYVVLVKKLNLLKISEDKSLLNFDMVNLLDNVDELEKKHGIKLENWAKSLFNKEIYEILYNLVYLRDIREYIDFECLFDDLYGFVQLIDFMGSDKDIVLAAKTSYGIKTIKMSSTVRLIDYLMRHRHTSPFEMCEVKFRIRIPMDAWRQMIRHRTASVNERSTRYTKALTRFYKRRDNWNYQDTINKQGSGDAVTDKELKYRLMKEEDKLHNELLKSYLYKINNNISKEQARKDLPLCTYTEAIWKIDLHNLLHFLELRLTKYSQYEIRRYAQLLSFFVERLFHTTWISFSRHIINGARFSSDELELIKKFLDKEKLLNSAELNAMKESKKIEFLEKLKL